MTLVRIWFLPLCASLPLSSPRPSPGRSASSSAGSSWFTRSCRRRGVSAPRRPPSARLALRARGAVSAAPAHSGHSTGHAGAGGGLALPAPSVTRDCLGHRGARL